MGKRTSRYSDIIDLPHHQSEYRPHMPVSSRAAQFAPFAALVGYEEMVHITTEAQNFRGRKSLDENEKELLDRKLFYIKKHLDERNEVCVTFFDKTTNRVGGEYTSYSGRIKKFVECPFQIIFMDGKKIQGKDIISIEEF